MELLFLLKEKEIALIVRNLISKVDCILKYEHAVGMYKNSSTSACSAFSSLASLETTGK